MTKNQKIITAIAALTGLYLLYKYFKSGQPTIGSSINASDTKKDEQVKSGSKYIYPLKKGSRGDVVGMLQTALGGRKNLPKYGIDSNFGEETEAAVIKALKKPQVDNFEEILKIANINNLAYDSKTKKFYTPKGGVTSRVSDFG
jgi:peptidoglycan hydrolase-like protein with peptidoglycan-binding domain